ncbi:MAG: hypothetical protein EBY17_27985 [Acidobacteriia bacterium]|nr:hypothetical protein [Terriglobia bacterium]
MDNQFASLDSQRVDTNSNFQSSPVFSDDGADESIAGNSSLPGSNGWFESLKRWFMPAKPQGQTVNVDGLQTDTMLSKEPDYSPHPTGSFVALCVSAGFQEPTRDGRPVFRVVFRTTARRRQGSAQLIGSRFIGPFGENHHLWKFLGHWRGRPFTSAEREAGIHYEQLVGSSGVITVDRNSRCPAKGSFIRRLKPCPAELGRGLKGVLRQPRKRSTYLNRRS